MENNIENKKLNIFQSFIKRLKDLHNTIWSSKLYTFFLLLFILSVVMVFMFTFTAFKGGFFHINSDDILQYYVYGSGFFEKLKTGTLSLYDKNLLIGTSFFSGVYYIPLDGFTFFAFLLSFIIPNEYAYCLSFYLRIALGALLFYYVLVRKLNNKAAFFASLILFIGGLTEAYYIFPVYLGVVFYAPLAMLLVDLIIEKKKLLWYLLIPIYTASVIFYDFYIAYMLLAFLGFYFIIKNHISNEFSIIGKNTIFKNGKFWLSFLKFVVAILIGLLISMAILLPSALYVLNESNRAGTNINESLLYFSVKNDDGTYSISWRHYFTQFINLFMPNEPHRFCLNDAGDYVREHASLYVTSGGLIFLISFFFIKGKEENRLKFWVILFNILFLIPAVSIFLGLNASPYIRWFFIPYMLNIYAMAISMNKNNMMVGDRNIIKFFPLLILFAGLLSLTLTLILSPSVFIHYKSTDPLFYLILIPSIILNLAYIVILVLSFIFEHLNKNTKLLHKLLPITIFVECLFAGAIIFLNADNTSTYYMNAETEMESQVKELKKLGYNEKDGYRINLYTGYARGTTNANILEGVNFGSFFQSFYNTPIDKVLSEFYSESSTSWSRKFNYGYNLLSGPIFNVKYVVTSENVVFPEKYYDKTVKNNTTYNIFKEDIPFIVYDDIFSETSNISGNDLKLEASLLYYAYIKNVTSPSNKYEEYLADSYDKVINKYNFTKVKSKEISTYLNNSEFNIKSCYKYEYETDIKGNRVYNIDSSLSNVINNDVLLIWPTLNIRRNAGSGFYFRDDTINDITNDNYYNNLHRMHYNIWYKTDDYTRKNIVIEPSNKDDDGNVTFYSFSYNLLDRFIERQNLYTDKSFTLDGTKMNIKFKIADTSRPRIVKTGYAYSEDWNIVNEGYEKIVVDDSFLGVIVPDGVSNVDITLKYNPKGFKPGLLVSGAGILIYLGITIPYLVIIIKKRRLKNEDNFNNNSLL